MHAPWPTLSSAASLHPKERTRIPLQRRRAPSQRNLSLFDLLLHEIYVLETVENED